MTIEHMRAAREANPFRPFTIHLADGRSHHVPHRDYLSMSPGSGRTVIIYQGDESFNFLDLLLVTELTMDAPSTQAADG